MATTENICGISGGWLPGSSAISPPKPPKQKTPKISDAEINAAHDAKHQAALGTAPPPPSKAKVFGEGPNDPSEALGEPGEALSKRKKGVRSSRVLRARALEDAPLGKASEKLGG